ncbi:kinase-like domain-containing protein [Xylariaceae sp. FL0016]|nr:kinase-like domain-containing protein [Xylariaceae sp. FL0016]
MSTVTAASFRPRGGLNSSEALPVLPDQITAEWCSAALGRPVRSVSIVNELHGTASKILVELTYENGDAATDGNTVRSPPRHLCVKGGFNPQLLALYPGLNATYRREAEFYYHIAPAAPSMRLPTAWYCGSDIVSGQGVVLMDDLQDAHCTFGTPLSPWPPARAHAAVSQLAALHASTWGAPSATFPWLGDDSAARSNPLHDMVRALLAPAAWDPLFGGADRPPAVPEHMADRERALAAFETLWRTTDPRFRCVVHGDAHIGNTFISAAGEPGFIDWQALHAGSAFHDLAYFISGVLTPEDRRAHENALLDTYFEELAQLGGPRFHREEVWDEYRKTLWYGFAWSLTAPGMQPRENVFAMVERHIAAIVDHGSLELLESLPK